jgi:hypothetical protein
MKNTDFYAYCRGNRKTETDPNKKAVLQEVYMFMFECGTTKAGVKQFVDHMIYQKSNEPAKVAAYQWLQGVFDSPSIPVQSDGQMQLF